MSVRFIGGTLPGSAEDDLVRPPCGPVLVTSGQPRLEYIFLHYCTMTDPIQQPTTRFVRHMEFYLSPCHFDSHPALPSTPTLNRRAVSAVIEPTKLIPAQELARYWAVEQGLACENHELA